MTTNLTMKALPDTQKPYEKCMRHGPEALSDAELISAIIRTGTKGEKCIDLAGRVLTVRPDGLLNLIYMNIDELKEIHGIGGVKAVQLKCIGELAKRITTSVRHTSCIMNNSEKIAEYYMERLRHEPKEVLLLAMFDRKNMLLGDHIISIGTSNASLISPGEIFKTALMMKAEYIILLHNHPSGNPQPSSADIQVTRNIQACGEMMGIQLVDHIVIGDNCYYSFYEHKMLVNKGE